MLYLKATLLRMPGFHLKGNDRILLYQGGRGTSYREVLEREGFELSYDI